MGCPHGTSHPTRVAKLSPKGTAKDPGTCSWLNIRSPRASTMIAFSSNLFRIDRGVRAAAVDVGHVTVIAGVRPQAGQRVKLTKASSSV